MSVHRQAVLAVLTVGLLTSCTAATQKPAADSVKPPTVGACRRLAPGDITQPTNASPTVPCTRRHTAQTYAVGTFPASLTRSKVPDDHALGAWLFHRCQSRFKRFLGADDSLLLRASVTWAWFRPSQAAWAKGAHWWRCDVVGGGEQSPSFQTLPATAKGILLGKPADRWLICVNGPTVSGSVKIPCSRRHTWRAVTTIVLGKTSDPYPGDRLVAVRTRDYCSNSVGAWLNYPVDYDYGYTWFHRAEWKTGNRRSICWAKTTQ